MTMPARPRGVRVASASVLAAGLLLVVPACTDKAEGASVAVTGTDDSCTLDTNEVTAGPNAFEFTNRGTKVSEIYVLQLDGDVVGEVEDVTPGATRTLDTDLVAGQYLVRCKPGQTGDGIDDPFTVTGEGGAVQAEPDRTITFDAVDFTYQQLDLTGISAGETIRFEMDNSGEQPHEFEVLNPAGDPIGEVASVAVGERGGATITFDEAGTFTYQCILIDPKTGEKHTMLGMTGTFEVGDA